jgi:glycogen operon protein
MNALPNEYSQAALQPGSPSPLGATWTGDGVNFAVFSSGATRIELCIFDPAGERELARLALPERSDNIWHGFLPAPLGAAVLVSGLRADGPFDPAPGRRYTVL